MSSTVLIITIFISCIFGVKKPLFGGLAGAIIAPILYSILASFKLTTFLIYIPLGFIFSFGSSFLASLIYSGTRGKGHNSGPSIIGQSGGHGFSEHTGGIILNDNERKGIKSKIET